MHVFVQLLLLFLPWRLRRFALRRLLGFDLHTSARIGFSVIAASRVMMGARAKVGHLTFVKGLDVFEMENDSRLGNLNWVTAFPTGSLAKHFHDQPDRRPVLALRAHSAITNRHLIDCTGGVFIGAFSTLAGFRSQVLTHSIDLVSSTQRAAPVHVGDYCFVGTGANLLAGSSLPSYSVLGAGSLLNKKFEQRYTLYAGVPARSVKELDRELLYFQRTCGFVN